LNNVYDRLNRIATLLFDMTHFTIVAANPSTFFDQRAGWSCSVHVCIIANRIMNANSGRYLNGFEFKYVLKVRKNQK
jgi:hypothetical protein